MKGSRPAYPSANSMFENSEILSNKFSQLLDKWSVRPRVKDYPDLYKFLQENTSGKKWEQSIINIKKQMFTAGTPIFGMVKNLYNGYISTDLKEAYFGFCDEIQTSVKSRWKDLITEYHDSNKESKAYHEWVKDDDFDNEIWIDLTENENEKKSILDFHRIPSIEYGDFLRVWRGKRNIWSHLDRVFMGPAPKDKPNKIVRDLKHFLEMEEKTPDQLISEIGATIKFLLPRDNIIHEKTNPEAGLHFLHLSDNKHKSLKKAESIRYRYDLLDWKEYVPVKAIDEDGSVMVGIEGLRAELAGEKGVSNVVEISGLGGLGKSALVQHYIYRSISDEYPEFEEYEEYFFFTAKTEEQGDWETDYHERKLGRRTRNPREFARGMGDFSQGLLFDNFLRRLAPSGAMDARSEVLEILKTQKILIVLDNYEDVDSKEKKKYRDFFGTLGRDCRTRVIITGRPTEKSRHAKIILQNMDSKEATQLMIRRFEYLYGQNNKSWVPRNQDLKTLTHYKNGDKNLVDDIEKTLEGPREDIFKEIRGHPGVLMYIVSLLGSKDIREDLDISEGVEFEDYLKRVALDKKYGFDKFVDDMFSWITKKAYDRLIMDPMCKLILNLLSTKSDLTLSDIKEELSQKEEKVDLKNVEPAIRELENNNHFIIENKENKAYSLHPHSHRFLTDLVTENKGCKWILDYLSNSGACTTAELKESFALKSGIRADEFDSCFNQLIFYDVFLEVNKNTVNITRAGFKVLDKEMDQFPSIKPKQEESEGAAPTFTKPSITEDDLALQLSSSLSQLPNLDDHEPEIEAYLIKSRLLKLAQVDLGTFRTLLDYFIKTEALLREDSEYPQRGILFANVSSRITDEFFQESQIPNNDVYEIEVILDLILAEPNPNISLKNLGKLPTFFPELWRSNDRLNWYEKIYFKLYSKHYKPQDFHVSELNDQLWESWLNFLLHFEENGLVKQKYVYKHMIYIISRHNGQKITGFRNKFNRMKQVQNFFQNYSHKLPWTKENLTFLLEIESIYVASGWQEWDEWPRFTVPSPFTSDDFEELDLGCAVQYRDLNGNVVEPEKDKEMVCSVQYLTKRRLELRILPQSSQEIESIVDETVLEFAQNQVQRRNTNSLPIETIKEQQNKSTAKKEILEILNPLIKDMLEESTTNTLLVKNIYDRFRQLHPNHPTTDEELAQYLSSNELRKADPDFEFTITNLGRSDETLRWHRLLPGVDEDAEKEFIEWFTSSSKKGTKNLYPTFSLDSGLVIKTIREVQKTVKSKFSSDDVPESVMLFANQVKKLVWQNFSTQISDSNRWNIESIAWTLCYHYSAKQKDIFNDHICIETLHFEAKRRANLYASKITQAQKKVFDRNIGKWRDDLFALIELENEASIVIPRQSVAQEKKEAQPTDVVNEMAAIATNFARQSQVSQQSIINAVNLGYELWIENKNKSFRSLFYETFKQQNRMHYRRVFPLRIHENFLSYIVKNTVLLHGMRLADQDFHTCAVHAFFEE